MLHPRLPFELKTGKLIVFEGLDGTGKSTQLRRFEKSCEDPDYGDPLYEPMPMFTHQPSGATGLGPKIYKLTEKVDWRKASPVTRQLLHLAAHNEHYLNDIIPALATTSVFMDRCWWSAMAYGYRDEIADMLTWEQFMTMVQLPTHGIMPDVVYLFLSRHTKRDKKAGDDAVVLENYLRLRDTFPDRVSMIPDHNMGEVTAFISGDLKRRGLVRVEEH